MVGFGKSILKARRQGWNEAYLDYAALKEYVNEIEKVLTERKSIGFGSGLATRNTSREAIMEEGMPRNDKVQALKNSFLSELKSEVEKVSLFILQQQGRLADAVGVLRCNTKSPLLFDQKNALLISNPSGIGSDINHVLDQYAVLGVELLHLLKFACVNSIGIRKILKKYNKCVVERLDEPHRYEVNGDHLQQLAYSPSIRAIESSLQSALVESFTTLPPPTFDATAASMTTGDQTVSKLRFNRFRCVMSCNERLRRNAEILQQPFWEFLSRKAMVSTGAILGGMEGHGKKALEWLIRLRPEKLLTMTDAQLEKLWARWSVGPKVSNVRENKEWSRRGEFDVDDLSSLSVSNLKNESPYWGGVNSASMILNLLSTLLYTINYYIVAPTANHYAIALGADGAFGSTLIGASSFSALFAAFFYSFWYTKSSFKSALIFSAFCPVVGNLMYGLAISYNSMQMAIFGRILCGFGSAEVANRQLISACVSFEGMTKASALFVAAGALGMSVGPLLAAILDISTGRDFDLDISLPLFPVGGIVFNHVTSPGFVMTGFWLMELIALVLLFREPKRINGGTEKSSRASRTDISISGSSDESSDDGIPLLGNTKCYGSVSSDGTIYKDTSATTSVWEELAITCKLIVQNTGLPVTLLLFGYIELADEVLISSCSMVVRRYFGWHGSVAGFLIASLGALVLPAHFVVEKASRYFSERRILSQSLVFLVISLLGIINWSGMLYDIVGALADDDVDDSKDYSHLRVFGVGLESLLTNKGEFLYDFGSGPVVYIVFLSATFMGTIVLEGVDTSIMAKVTPAALNDRFVNCGLLATLIGTLGRVLADAAITFSALMDIHVLVDFVNATFIPLLLLTVLGFYMCRKFYKRLC